MYAVSPRQFRNWCHDAGLDLGRCNTLTPSKVKLVFDTFGIPVRSLDGNSDVEGASKFNLPPRKQRPS